MCIVTNSGPTCKCSPGEVGNPFPGGSCSTDQCSSNRPCAEPQVCINGRCKQKCDGVVCGVGATCDNASGKCVCEPFFVGNPEMLCMPRKLFKCCVTIFRTLIVINLSLQLSPHLVAAQSADRTLTVSMVSCRIAVSVIQA